jgi:hypothetical protein
VSERSPALGRRCLEARVTRRAVLHSLAAAGAAACIPKASARETLRGRTALVIGAGIAGLSAAYELCKAGFDVTVFEKDPWPGGRMRDAWKGPLFGNTHAIAISPFYRELFDLAAELGISEGLLPPPMVEFGYDLDNGHGTYRCTSSWLPQWISRIPGLSDGTRRQLPTIQKDIQEIKQAVDPCFLAHGGAAYDDQTLEEYFNLKLDPVAADEVIRYWVEPAASWWGWPKSITSRIALLSWLAQETPVFYPPGWGIGVVTSKLASILRNRIKFLHAVRFVSPPDASGRHTVTYLDQDFVQRTATPDVVVVCTEGKYVYDLVQGLSSSEVTFFKPTTTTVQGSVVYILKGGSTPPYRIGGSYIPQHPDSWKRRVTSWSVTPAQLAAYYIPVNPNEPINPEGGGSWYVVPPERGEYIRPACATVNLSREYTAVWQMSNQPIEDFCAPLIGHLWPEFDMRNVIEVVNYSADDLSQMPVGYVRQMTAIVRAQEKARRGLYYAGEYVSGCLTGAACASGRVTARTIISHWLS